MLFDLLDADQKQILRDALHEFCSNRSPLADYIATRYSRMDDAFRHRKLDEVIKRLALAETLLNALFTSKD